MSSGRDGNVDQVSGTTYDLEAEAPAEESFGLPAGQAAEVTTPDPPARHLGARSSAALNSWTTAAS